MSKITKIFVIFRYRNIFKEGEDSYIGVVIGIIIFILLILAAILASIFIYRRWTGKSKLSYHHFHYLYLYYSNYFFLNFSSKLPYF